MVNMQTVTKMAKLFGYASLAFAVILAIIEPLLIQTASAGAPADYIILYTLQAIWPYLFVAVLSLLIAYKASPAEEKEEAPTEQTKLP